MSIMRVKRIINPRSPKLKGEKEKENYCLFDSLLKIVGSRWFKKWIMKFLLLFIDEIFKSNDRSEGKEYMLNQLPNLLISLGQLGVILGLFWCLLSLVSLSKRSLLPVDLVKRLLLPIFHLSNPGNSMLTAQPQ